MSTLSPSWSTAYLFEMTDPRRPLNGLSFNYWCCSQNGWHYVAARLAAFWAMLVRTGKRPNISPLLISMTDVASYRLNRARRSSYRMTGAFRLEYECYPEAREMGAERSVSEKDYLDA